MPSIQIKNVPDEVHRVLRRRAGEAGQSLQEYLLGRLIDYANHPTLTEVFGNVAARSGGKLPLADAAELIRDERDAA